MSQNPRQPQNQPLVQPLRKKTAMVEAPLPAQVETKRGPVKLPPLLGLDRFGMEFVQTWTRCEPETVAGWILDGTLGSRAKAAQEAMPETIATLVSQGHTHAEASHEATIQHLQPPLNQE